MLPRSPSTKGSYHSTGNRTIGLNVFNEDLILNQLKRWGDWWTEGPRFSRWLPTKALEKIEAEHLLSCPICQQGFSDYDGCKAHCGRDLIHSEKYGTSLAVNSRPGPHSFINPSILMEDGSSFSERIGLNGQDEVDLIKHCRTIPSSEIENPSTILHHRNWRLVWGNHLKRGLGERLLHHDLHEDLQKWARITGVNNVGVEWNYPLRSNGDAGAHEADCMLFDKADSAYSLAIPWESKLHCSLKKNQWLISCSRVIYSTIRTCGRIDGYGLKVLKDINVQEYVKFLLNGGNGFKIDIKDGSKMVLRFNDIRRCDQYSMDITIQGKISYSGTIYFWINAFKVDSTNIRAYIENLLKTIEAKITSSSHKSIPPLESSKIIVKGRKTPKKNFSRYADVFLLIQRATRAGRAQNKSTIMRSLPQLTPKQLEATIDGLLRSKKIVRMRSLNELPAVVLSKVVTYFSTYIIGSKLRSNQWYIVPYIDGTFVDEGSISKNEIEIRGSLRNSLDRSELVRDMSQEIASEIRGSDLRRADKNQITDAIKRFLESKLDEILAKTGIGITFR
jgi:hypothetical protein